MGVAASASARRASASPRERAEAAPSARASLTYRRKSVATWSFRERPVCSFPASGPTLAARRASTKECTSSSSASCGTPVFATSTPISSRPATSFLTSPGGSTSAAPRASAQAIEPRRSSARSARSNPNESLKARRDCAGGSEKRPPQSWRRVNASPLPADNGLIRGSGLQAQAALRGQAEEADESGRVGRRVAAHVERREVRRIERVGRRAADDGRRALEELERDVAGHGRHQRVHERVQRLAERREPLAEVEELGIAGGELFLLVDDVAVERERLEGAERHDEERAARRLVDAARLDSDQPVLDDVHATDAVPATDLVELLDERHRRELLAVHRDRQPRREGDRHALRSVGSLLGVHGQLEHRGLGLEARLFQRAAFVGNVPEVAIARVGILLRGGDGYAACRGVIDGVLARLDVPLAPGRDDRELRRERHVGELEPDLVVALSGAAVREGVAPRRERDFDLLLGDEGTRGRRPEQVVVLVGGAGLQHRKKVIARELVLRVDEEELRRAGLPRLLLETRGLLGLADVDRDGDHLASVVLLQPGDDDGRVESARVGECGLLDLRLHETFSFGASRRISSSALMNPDSAGRGTTYGGRRRRTFVRDVPTTKPFARSAFCTAAASRFSSTPHMRPRPRTSTIAPLLRFFAFRSFFPNHSPVSRIPSRRPPSTISESVSSPRRHAIGLPPKVVPWCPGLTSGAIRSLTRTAPSGRPPPRGLASVTRSGATPISWKTKRWPVRPRPD